MHLKADAAARIEVERFEWVVKEVCGEDDIPAFLGLSGPRNWRSSGRFFFQVSKSFNKV